MRYIKNFNENIEEELCRYIDDYEYQNCRDKDRQIIGDKAIEIFKEQIKLLLDEYGQTFDENLMKYRQTRLTYNGNPLLKMSLSLLDDEWYLIEAYINWGFCTFLS